MRKLFFVLIMLLIAAGCAYAGPIVLYNSSGTEVGTSGHPLKVSCTSGCSGGGDLSSTDIDTFAELDAIVADQTLVHSGSNIATATALFANGSNCSSGNAPLGVDASGAVESCFDVWTEAENTAAAYIATLVEDTTPQAGGTLDMQSYAIQFEGSIADDFEGVLDVENPQTDRTTYIPDIPGPYLVKSAFGRDSLPTDGYFAQWESDGTLIAVAPPAGGDTNSGATNSDNVIARYDGTNSKTIQSSGVTIDDSNNIVTAGNITGATGSFSSLVITGTGDSTWDTTGGTIAVADYSADILYLGGSVAGSNKWSMSLGGALAPAGTATFMIPNSTTLPATCTVGQIYMDTDATSGQRIYACQATNTWALQGDGGAGGFDSTAVDATTWSDGANASNVWTFDVSGTDHTITFGNNNVTFSAAGVVVEYFTANDGITSEKEVYLAEQAAANVDAAGYGQLWVKNDTPNILMFTDDAGTDRKVNVGSKDFSLVLESPADADSLLIKKFLKAVTITDIHCIVDPADSAESAVIDIRECDSAGDTCSTVDATITCDNDGAEDDGTLTNGTIDANDWVLLDIGTVTGTVTTLTITVQYDE